MGNTDFVTSAGRSYRRQCGECGEREVHKNLAQEAPRVASDWKIFVDIFTREESNYYDCMESLD